MKDDRVFAFVPENGG